MFIHVEYSLLNLSFMLSCYQGIPEQAEVPHVAQAPSSGQGVNPPAQAQRPAQPAVPSSGPNANPLDLFPQVGMVLCSKYSF